VLVAIKIGWYALVVGGFPFIPARNDQPARAAVVAQIERGVLPVGTDGYVELPLGSADLSIGGFVRTYPNVDHGGRAILFVTTLGAVDRYSGYIYSPQDTPPDDDPMGGADWTWSHSVTVGLPSRQREFPSSGRVTFPHTD
jgi:hypothetical protein